MSFGNEWPTLQPAALAFLQGFEAAARTLSFTKAAEELFVTQSAVSRQIKALEDDLGLRLFERRARSLALTENGQALYRIATDVFDRLQTATDRLRAETRARQLAITTTTGFASLWLIPRLRRFTALHPDIDVRLSATTDALNLERSLIDVAIRYCRPEAVPEGAVRLFGEEMIPVCSRALLRDKARPLILCCISSMLAPKLMWIGVPGSRRSASASSNLRARFTSASMSR
jgi:DNA-binding transcriptional LysR family regulator